MPAQRHSNPLAFLGKSSFHQRTFLRAQVTLERTISMSHIADIALNLCKNDRWENEKCNSNRSVCPVAYGYDHLVRTTSCIAMHGVRTL